MSPLEYLKVINTVLKEYCEQKGYESTVEMDSFAGLVRIVIREDNNILFDETMDYRKINIWDELIDYIDHFIKNYNENFKRDNIFKFINQAIKTHIENTGSRKIKFVCNEAIEPYAREYFKDSNVEIVVSKAYKEVEEKND